MSRLPIGDRGRVPVMTLTTLEGPRSKNSYYCVDAEDERPCQPEVSRADLTDADSYYLAGEEPRAITARTFAARWQHADAVSELISELFISGRTREAAAIRRVLGHDDDEAAMRAYVSRLWAEDWDSPEDSVYDD